MKFPGRQERRGIPPAVLVVLSMTMDAHSRTVTAAVMKHLDETTIVSHHVPSAVLMERAGLAVVQALRDERFDLGRILVVSGPGNNGGDGVVVARLLHLAGASVEVILVGDETKRSQDMIRQIEVADSYGITLLSWGPDVSTPGEPTTVVDALLGIGGDRAPGGDFLQAVRHINACRDAGARVLAVDIPSGISTDTGQLLGEAVHADVTVTFAYAKTGLVQPPGNTLAGRLIVADIGIYAE
ncbi:MAG: NAD(P)H-hydrate epimerase [Propionibacteriaceae bacterium]|nr:NAD(P)H-hydrate epimerase [Propionibacteriaceae bacterium]